MKIQMEEKDRGVVIKLNGNIIGIPDETEFDNAIKSMVSKNKLNIVVDLGDISYINSTGLGIILRGYISIKNAGGSFKLASLNKKLKTLLEITKLNSIIDIHNSVESALVTKN